jgi:hypothetical protein
MTIAEPMGFRLDRNKAKVPKWDLVAKPTVCSLSTHSAISKLRFFSISRLWSYAESGSATASARRRSNDA